MGEEQVEAPRRIVVGVDGSEPSKAALRWADRVAGATGAGIEAVIAWQYPPMYGGPTELRRQPETEASHIVQNTLHEVFGAHPPPMLEASVRRGHPRDVLLAASEDAEMLVVGSRGHGGFVGLLLGSVSMACAEHARCPVLVVHGAR
jgi:nucleotide-binding universal stress UspA family protein